LAFPLYYGPDERYCLKIQGYSVAYLLLFIFGEKWKGGMKGAQWMMTH